MDSGLPIRDLATACKNHFHEYLKSPCPGATRIAKDQQACFNNWASKVGVSDHDTHAPLDERLTESNQEAVKEVILQLLRAIDDNLKEGRKSGQTIVK